MLPKNLTVEDVREYELFQSWMAKVDVLKKSGVEYQTALVQAYQEVYYPSVPTVTEDE